MGQLHPQGLGEMGHLERGVLNVALLIYEETRKYLVITEEAVLTFYQ